MTLNKKIWRTILENKTRYIGAILLILISSALYTSFGIAGENVKKGLVRFQNDNVLEDASFVLQTPLVGISELEQEFDLVLEERRSYDFPYAQDTTLRILQETDKVDKYVAVLGTPLQAPKDILIDQGFAGAHQLKVGDRVEIDGVSFHITGYMTTPDYVYPLKTESDMIKNPDRFGIAVLSEKDFKELDGGLMYYSVKFNKDNRAEFKNALAQNNLVIRWIDKENNTRITFIKGDLEGFIQMGKVVPATILILTCVLLSVVLWRMLKGEFIQLGTLYALGYRRVELLTHYLTYPVFLCFTGGLLGNVLGIFLVGPLLQMITLYYNLPVIVTDYSLRYLSISFLLPFAFLIPITFLVVMKALRLSPLILMRGGEKKSKVNLLEKSLKLKRFSFETKFKIREMVRNIPRTLLMILGVTFASMLLLFGFATKDSIDYMMRQGYDDIYKYDYDYILNSFNQDVTLEGDKVSFSTFTSDSNNKENGTFVIYGIEKDSKFIELRDKQGNSLDKDQVIISASFAEKLGIQEGDLLNVKNKLNSQRFTLKIEKIANVYIGDFIYMPLDRFNALNGYPKASFLEVLTDKKLDIDQKDLMMETRKSEIVEGYNALIQPFRYMIGVIAITAFIIGLIVIHVVTSLVIEENTSSISLLKILGYDRRKINSLILGSNTFLVFIGYVLSVPLIIFSVDRMFAAFTYEMNITIPAKLNEINIIIGFVFIWITYEISKGLNRRKVSSISMADSLKYKAE